MNPDASVYFGLSAVLLAVVAFLVGRRTGGAARRQRELEAELAHAREDLANLQSELETVRADLTTAREEHEAYRLDVVEHFSGTSDLLRDLTVQYRAVYEHLTLGASTLCPEGFVGLTEGLTMPELPEPQREVHEVRDAAAEPAGEEANGSGAADRDADKPTLPLSV